MRRDVASAYAASGAKVASWVVVSAVVFRWYGPATFAAVALVRGVLGLLNYTALGLGPAMIRELSRVRPAADELPPADAGGTLAYATPEADYYPNLPDDSATRRVFYAGRLIASAAACLAGILIVIYSDWFEVIHRVPAGVEDVGLLVLLFGFGSVARLASDAGGAVLQTRGRIAFDNALLALADAAWAALTVGLLALPLHRASFATPTRAMLLHAVQDPFFLIGLAYLTCNGGLYLLRMSAAGRELGVRLMLWPRSVQKADGALVRRLLSFGGMVTVAQLADFLYAPTDYILISALLNPLDIAAYAPAVQIDAGLLLLVAGLANVLLPKAALAHAADDAAAVRRYYVRGTLASAALLALAAGAVWALAPWLLKLWLGQDLPATRAILPGILIHTVVGGSGAVGRSVLIGVGRVRAFTVSVLIAGAANVALSILFVKLGLGLWGIVLGTVCVVVARCGVWMPWYVLRVLGEERYFDAGTESRASR